MFILTLNQLIKMLIILFLGFICFKKGIIDQQGNRGLSNALLILVNPCLVMTIYQVDYDPKLTEGLVISLCAAVVVQLLGILVARLLISKKSEEFAIERFASAYPNVGFMGIPLINSVIGPEGVFYLSAYITVFNILTWTHGLSLLHGKLDKESLKEGLKQPMLIATFISVILYFLKIRLPAPILDSMQYLANMNTALAMLVAGIAVAQADVLRLFKNVRIYLVSLLKLFVMPLVVMVFLIFSKIDSTVAYTLLIAAACPTATTLTMMSIRYDKNYKYASELFSFTTVLSTITIPIIVLIAGYFM